MTDKQPLLFPYQLTDVRLYEIKTERMQVEKTTPTSPIFSVQLQTPSEIPEGNEFSMVLSLETNFLTEEKIPECFLSISIEGIFSLVVDKNTIKPEVFQEFREKTAILLLWPYLRQSVYDITARLRLPVYPLPIANPVGLITFI